MKWVLKRIDKETNHRFLNLYTYHFAVGEEGKDYSYFVASRHENIEDLRAKTQDFSRPDGVLIVLYREGKKGKEVLLVKEYRPALKAYCIEFPAGLMDEEDEDEIATARREAKEETGVEASNLSLLMPPSPTSSGLSDETVSVVIGEVKEEGQTSLEEFEDIGHKFVSLRELKRILDDPTLIVAANVRLICLLLLERWGK